MKLTRKTVQTSIGDDFIGTKFGPNNCLEVVAWCGEKSYYNKKYTVFCSICADDPELFGLGLFLITKNKILLGRVPCGCSKNVYRWTEDQYKTKIHREIESRKFKYEFLGFAEPFKGSKTKIVLNCELGTTESVTISNFLKGQYCKLHRDRDVGIKNTKDDAACVEAFMKTGSYAEGTIFTRSDVKDYNGWNCNWDVYCPICNENYRSHISNMSVGCRGCSCSQRLHTRAYIHLLQSENATIALKYGITSMGNGRRLKEQNKKSAFKVYEAAVWKFSEVSSCRRAEQECKLFYSRLLSKEEMPDGWTETTSVLNFINIVNIFEHYGGIREK